MNNPYWFFYGPGAGYTRSSLSDEYDSADGSIIKPIVPLDSSSPFLSAEEDIGASFDPSVSDSSESIFGDSLFLSDNKPLNMNPDSNFVSDESGEQDSSLFGETA